MINPALLQSLAALNEAQVINKPQKNLRSKIESLIRSIENLEAKRARIDYELKKQKRSLARKRMELKKDSKHLASKLESATGSGVLNEHVQRQIQDLRNQDNSLLQKSAEILENF